MNTEEAENKLRDHGYIVIPSRTRKSFEVRRPDQNGIPLYLPSGKRGRKVMYELNRLSPRELIRMAKSYTSDSPGRTAFKKPLKEYQAKRDRRKTKQAIKHENIDSIPLNKPLHEENRWNWD